MRTIRLRPWTRCARSLPKSHIPTACAAGPRLVRLRRQLDDRVGAHRRHPVARQDNGRNEESDRHAQGLLTSLNYGYDPAFSRLYALPTTGGATDHFVWIFGGAETAYELQTLIDDPAWNKAWVGLLQGSRKKRWRAALRLRRAGDRRCGAGTLRLGAVQSSRGRDVVVRFVDRRRKDRPRGRPGNAATDRRISESDRNRRDRAGRADNYRIAGDRGKYLPETSCPPPDNKTALKFMLNRKSATNTGVLRAALIALTAVAPLAAQAQSVAPPSDAAPSASARIHHPPARRRRARVPRRCRIRLARPRRPTRLPGPFPPISTGPGRAGGGWASAVDEAGITRLLERFRDAGIGGVEICPIYGAKGAEERFIDFLSPKWMEMLAHTTAEAKRLGLGVDMTTGTGWPFGGPNVTPTTTPRPRRC